jgi:hypothetical protein
MGIVLEIRVLGYITLSTGSHRRFEICSTFVMVEHLSKRWQLLTSGHGVKKKQKTGIFNLNVNLCFDQELNLEPPEYEFACYLHDHGVQS